MKNILIVDDEPRITQAFEMSFEFEENYNIQSCREGKEAVNILDKQAPDLLVLDWRLNGELEGRDVLEHVKQHHPGLPVFVVTASIDFVEEIKSFSPTAYFLKPCPELKSKILERLGT